MMNINIPGAGKSSKLSLATYISQGQSAAYQRINRSPASPSRLDHKKYSPTRKIRASKINMLFSSKLSPGKYPVMNATRKPKVRYPSKNKLAKTLITQRKGVGSDLILLAATGEVER